MKTGLIKSTYIHSNNQRFEGKYYLNSNSYLSMVLEQAKGKTKSLEEYAYVFNPPVFKRQFCKKTPRSVQYFQSSDVPSSIEKSEVFVFKGQAESLNLLVKKGDILVTGFGTIGNTKLVSSYQDGTCFANNVCRVRANPDAFPGFIYAVLTSKYGYAQLNKNASGSVVRYIESPGIRKTLIPNFPVPFQQEVDNLIQQSAKLREQAADALEKAHTIIDKEFSIAAKPKENKVAVKNIIKSHTTRLEGSYYTSANRSIYDYVIENYSYKTLKECSERIFRPGIFKREYLSRGVTFLGGADIMMAIPKSDKKLSYKQVMKMPELQVQKGWILVTCGGTIGNTVYVDNQIAKCVVSQHVMRVVPKENVLNGYLYAFLSSKIGHELITLFTYGSVIPSVESHHLEKVPIPVLDDEKTKHLDGLIQSYVECLELSKLKETLAITMVEEEIEKWQPTKPNEE